MERQSSGLRRKRLMREFIYASWADFLMVRASTRLYNT